MIGSGLPRFAFSRPRRFWRETRGSAAAEFVLCLTLLTLPILNVINLGFYAFERMQVEAAAESSVRAAWHLCNGSSAATALPTASCTGVLSAMQTAAQSTSLQTNVTLPAASVTEGYYCSNGSGGLSLVGAAGSTSKAPTAPSPNNCSTVIAGSTTAPGDYIQATASAPYTSLFNNVSLISLPTTITMQSWLRLDK